MKAWLGWISLIALAGCSSPGRELFIDLRTDLVPVAEWRFVEVELEGGGTETSVATGAEDWLRGERIAHFVDAPEFSEVTLRFYDDATRSLLLQRRVAVRVVGTTASTVTVTRSCVGVSCPRVADGADATECSGGLCVPPECVTGDEPTCDGECVRDDQCVVADPCARGVCRARVCLAEPRPGACGPDEYCDPAMGCRPLPTAQDAGVMDAGVMDAGVMDAGVMDAGADAGSMDAGVDAGPPDMGPPDMGPPDMGPPPCVPPSSVSGEITEADPTFERPRDETGANMCDTTRTTVTRNYDAHVFTNSCASPLDCTFDLIGDFEDMAWLTDPFLTMYAGRSIPADTLTAIACDDDGGDVVNARLQHVLAPGASVTMVATSFPSDPMYFGRYDLNVSCR